REPAAPRGRGIGAGARGLERPAAGGPAVDQRPDGGGASRERDAQAPAEELQRADQVRARARRAAADRAAAPGVSCAQAPSADAAVAGRADAAVAGRGPARVRTRACRGRGTSSPLSRSPCLASPPIPI